IAMASLACTRIVSPARASTSATLTSSSPWPLSTRASPSSSKRTTVTSTAVSEQVMQTSSWHSGTALGWPLWAVMPVLSRAAGSCQPPRAQGPRLLEEDVHQFPQQVVHGDVHLLAPPGIVGAGQQHVIRGRPGRDRPAVAAGQRDRQHAELP